MGYQPDIPAAYEVPVVGGLLYVLLYGVDGVHRSALRRTGLEFEIGTYRPR